MTDAQTSHLTAKRVALMDEGRTLRLVPSPLVP